MQFDATVPTVADRVAQTVVAMELEKVVEPKFHRSSYGYRPGRSALDAVEACRQRCFTHPWVLDCDIAGFLEPSSHWQRVHGGCVEEAGFGLWDQYS